MTSSLHERPATARGAQAAAVPVLMYHEISAEPLCVPRLAVTPDRFAEQLAFLRAGGYQTITGAQLAAAVKSAVAGLPARPVVLTFDDGFADFHDVALPLLREYGFTASLYVTSSWVAGERRRCHGGTPPGMLSWEQLRSIAAAGIEIGGHSLSHPQLDQLPADSLRQELSSNKHELEDKLGVAVAGLAYPFGYSSRLVRATAAATGYEYGCVVGNRLAKAGCDPFALPRLTIGSSTRLPGFARTVAATSLPAVFARYRMLTIGFSLLRHARAARNRIAR
ncbi:MAG TPA: polysaccharide deacetylase family protein [Streptosporangiaceae bacterium]|jgi:peptidoglycan/xylan/chitin deacetylase (PgdA/CDA1 family)|nr:polysaccharide deacetylase family protein [Streptosporangiaceae bacterium]